MDRWGVGKPRSRQRMNAQACPRRDERIHEIIHLTRPSSSAETVPTSI